MKKLNTYRTGQLSDILGMSRDVLRYYERKGIVKPKQEALNNYREYDFYDIYALMVGEFYKKRNFKINEVKKVKSGSKIDEIQTILEIKEKELEAAIHKQEVILHKINETKQFCNDIKMYLNNFSIRELPLYEVRGEISDLNAFFEYPVILENMDLTQEDILSNIMKIFTFDDTGFLEYKMYIVNRAERNQRIEGENYLDYINCIYTIAEDGRYQNGDIDIKDNIYKSACTWVKEQGLELLGVAFANTRLITYTDEKERVFLEVYIPIKEK